jgi:hypothetical protein
MTRYERERPGTGGVRAAVNGYLNRKFWDDPRCVEDAKGWVQPFANWQGWDEWNRAAYALRCVLSYARRGAHRQVVGSVFKTGPDGCLVVDRDALHRSMDAVRIESDLRTVQFALARSRRCDRPALP